MRLIDAELVYKILESCEIKKATIGNPLTEWEHGYTCGIERAESEIECAPTVDAIPVIRCKDCKYYLKSNEECELIKTRLYFYQEDKKWFEDSFCSWAERKEE